MNLSNQLAQQHTKKGRIIVEVERIYYCSSGINDITGTFQPPRWLSSAEQCLFFSKHLPHVYQCSMLNRYTRYSDMLDLGTLMHSTVGVGININRSKAEVLQYMPNTGKAGNRSAVAHLAGTRDAV